MPTVTIDMKFPFLLSQVCTWLPGDEYYNVCDMGYRDIVSLVYTFCISMLHLLQSGYAMRC